MTNQLTQYTSARHVHSRLVEACPECASEWSSLGALGDTFLSRLRDLPADPATAECSGELPAAQADIEAEEAFVSEIRRIHVRTLEEKSELLRTPLHRRLAKIHHARRRFRSCLLAEMLVAESIARVRRSPAEAAAIASLVGHVLSWTVERPPDAPPLPSWVAALRARAAAHTANAWRIAGDLSKADRILGEIRREDSAAPLPAPARAEIDSLEASLRTDQRRFLEAEALLTRAASVYRDHGDGHRLASTCIKQANLMWTLGHPAAMLPFLEDAAEAIDVAADPNLFLCTVTGRVNALCDLGRHAEARRLLAANLHQFGANDDPFLDAAYRCLEGRVALGLGETAVAEAAFAASQEGFLSLGRRYDAAMVAMFRAETLLAAGDSAKLRRLVGQLIPLFQGRGLANEALKALKMIVWTEAPGTGSEAPRIR